MNITDIEKILQNQLNPELSPSRELDAQAQQKMQAITQKKSKHWIAFLSILCLALMLLEIIIALSFIHSKELKFLFVGAHIALLCIFTSYAIISSDNTNLKKELHYV